VKLLSSAFLLIALGFAQVRGPAPASANAAGLKWNLSYLYDEDDSQLVLTDLKFPTPERGT
jgi:hypothetical protein